MPYDIQSEHGYNALFNQIVGNTGPGGFKWNDQNTGAKLQGMADQFAGMFRNAVGRDPTDQEMSSMYQNIGGQVMQSPSGFGGTDYAGFQNLFNPYLQNNYGPQIQQNQQQQQTGQLQKSTDLVQNLVNQVTGNTAKNLADPNSQAYAAFSGKMNNLGITPSSGAFQAGAGSQIAGSGMDAMNAGLQAVGLPAISGMNQTANAPYEMSLGNMYPGLNSYGGRNNDLMDWKLQSDFGQQMFNESQPSGMQSALQNANLATNAFHNLFSSGGVPGGSQSGTSYICMALIAHGLAAESDLDLLHLKTLSAVWKKARAFWWYATHAKELVQIAESKGLNWRMWRTWFLDAPMTKNTALEAVDEYITAYESLCRHLGAMHLWDERVRRASFWDSLLFLPQVMTYPPFLRAAWKVFRMKHMLLLDLPLTRMRDESR